MTVPFKIARGEFGLSLTDPAVDIGDDSLGNYTDFSCLITSGALTATQNIDTEDVPGTFCAPGSTNLVPTATTFALDVAVLQDPAEDTVSGLAKFLYDNDSGESGTSVWFYIGLAEGAAPKAHGKCFLVPVDFGGEPRVVLVGTLTLPCDGRPEIEFGTTPDV